MFTRREIMKLQGPPRQRIVAVIPARGGSKGIKDKNIIPLAGQPLIYYSIRAAQECSRIDEVIVTTDSERIAETARQCGAQVVMRPPELAADTAPTEPAMLHALAELKKRDGAYPQYAVLLQPTSPYRRPGALDRCLDIFFETGADSLLTVCESHSFFWKRKGRFGEALYDYRRRPRRQDIPDKDKLYRENGSIYITKTGVLLKQKNRLGGKIALAPVSEEESYEIDSPMDLRILEGILCERKEALKI